METDNKELRTYNDTAPNGEGTVHILNKLQIISALIGIIVGGLLFIGNFASGIIGLFGEFIPPEFLTMYPLQGLLILIISIVLFRRRKGLAEKLPDAFNGTLYMNLFLIALFATLGFYGVPFLLLSVGVLVILFTPGVKVFWFNEFVEDLKPRVKETRFTLHLIGKSPLVVVGIAIIVFMFGVAFTAPMIATYEGTEMVWADAKLPPGSPSNDFKLNFLYNFEDTELAIELVPTIYVGEVVVDETHLQTNETISLFFGISEMDTGVDDVNVTITARFFELDLTTYEGLTEVERTPFLVDSVTGNTSTVLQYFEIPDTATTYVWEIQFEASQKTTEWTANTRVVLKYYSLYPDHIWGTDNYGGDIYSRIVWGSQEDLRIAVSVVIVALSIGAIIGAASGYFGGKLDELVMRITDIFFAFPGLILAMAIVMALGERNLGNISIALMITWWPTYARLVRGQVLAEREKLYIEAARSIGASDTRILFYHIIPNTIQPVIVQATMDIGSVLLTAAGLAYIGFGPPIGTAEWGLMIANGQNFLLGSPWMTLFPGLAILVTALAFNLVGDGIRDILDPKLRRR